MLTHEMITNERKKMGLTSKHLANSLGVTLSTMTRYENGTIQHIPEDRLRKIAEILNCSYEYLTQDDPKYSKSVKKKETSHRIRGRSFFCKTVRLVQEAEPFDAKRSSKLD